MNEELYDQSQLGLAILRSVVEKRETDTDYLVSTDPTGAFIGVISVAMVLLESYTVVLNLQNPELTDEFKEEFKIQLLDNFTKVLIVNHLDQKSD